MLIYLSALRVMTAGAFDVNTLCEAWEKHSGISSVLEILGDLFAPTLDINLCL